MEYKVDDLASALQKEGLGRVFAEALATDRGGESKVATLDPEAIERGLQAIRTHLEKSLKLVKTSSADDDIEEEKVTLYVLGEVDTSGALVRQGCRWCQLTATSLAELGIPHETVREIGGGRERRRAGEKEGGTEGGKERRREGGRGWEREIEREREAK